MFSLTFFWRALRLYDPLRLLGHTKKQYQNQNLCKVLLWLKKKNANGNKMSMKSELKNMISCHGSIREAKCSQEPCTHLILRAFKR